MLRHKLCYLTACDYDKLYKHRTIFNIRQFPRNLLIRVDDEMFQNFSLYSIEDEDGEEISNYRYYGKNIIRDEEIDPGFTINPDDEYFLDPGFSNPYVPWEPLLPDEGDTNTELPDLGEGEVEFPDIDDSENGDNIDSSENGNEGTEEPDIELPNVDIPDIDGEENPEDPDGDSSDEDDTGNDEDFVDIIDLTVPKDPNCVEIEPINREILMRPWIELESKWLDTSIGLHNYILVWENNITGDTHLQYFTYVIQNSEPEKKYVYIDRESKNNKKENDTIIVVGGVEDESEEELDNEIPDFTVIEYFGDEDKDNLGENSDIDLEPDLENPDEGDKLPDGGEES